MRKLTQRLTSRTNSYSGHRWQFIWLIALLIFVQQIGKGQSSISASDCICNNDQSINGGKDGSFDATITVIDSSGTPSTWTVLDIGPLNPGAKNPVGITKLVDTLSFVKDSTYSISLMHFDSSGYTIQVTNGSDTLTHSNICEYPVISNFDVPDRDVMGASVEFKTGFTYHPSSSADTNFVFQGMNNQVGFDPSDLAVGSYSVLANLNLDSVSGASTNINSPANPGCITSISDVFNITDTRVSTLDLCICTGASDPDFAYSDTIRITTNASDTIEFIDTRVLNQDNQVLQVVQFFKDTMDLGASTRWLVGDTLARSGSTYEFVGIYDGSKDVEIRFKTASNDTIKIFLPGCDDTSDLIISGPDTLCQGESMASFMLSESVDSVVWTFGGKYSFSGSGTYNVPTIDTNGLITVTATGLVYENCVPFSKTKQVYVQDTSFEIEGNLYACLNDTLTYSLNLKGAFPDYSTIDGLKWSIGSGGRFISDSVNLDQVQIMWDTLISPHTITVTGVTTTGCEINAMVTVEVDSVLSGHIKGPQLVCQGETVGYRSSLDKIDVLTWTVLPDSVATVTKISEDSVNITWLMPGASHKIKVVGTADGGRCEIIDSSFNVVVKDTSFLLTGFDAACQQDSTTFSIRNSDGSVISSTDLRWYAIRHAAPTDTIFPSDTFMINSPMDSIEIKWDSIGDHTVYVTGTSSDGCEISESKTVNVRELDFTIFGDSMICDADTFIYMIYDANNMAVTNMQTISWRLEYKNPPGIQYGPELSDDTIKLVDIPFGEYILIADGMTDDGCPVLDSLDIRVIDDNDLKILGPGKLLGFRDTLWTLSAPDSVLNSVQWKVLNSTGSPTVSQTSQDSFRMTNYSFFGDLVYDSMNIVVTGMVGSSCTFTDTIPFILRDSVFQIFGDPIVCNISDSAIYHVDVPGIQSIAWSVSGAGNTIVDTIGTDKDSIAIVWATNGTITATINTVDGCTITDDQVVFVRDGSVILGDTAVCELDTVTYTLKGLTVTDTLDFSDLTSISWTFPSNATGTITNARMDSVQVVYDNRDGEPFYIDSISVSYTTNDGCQDTITQLIHIRESSYGIMGMMEICQDGNFDFKFGSFTGTGDIIDLPEVVVNDIAYANWTLPDGGTVVSSAGDSATLTFPATGEHRIMVSGAFNDSCKFEFEKTINIRSSLLELHGDTDGFFFDGQSTFFDIMEVDKGVSKSLTIDQIDGILWAVEDHGDIPSSTAYNARASLNSVLLASTAVAASPLSGSQSTIGDSLAAMVASSGLVSDLNNEYRGMVSSVTATFNTAGQDDHLFVGLVTAAGCTFSQTLDIAINNNTNTGSIACNNLVNVAMGPDCIFDVTPDLILEDVGDDQFDEYSIEITELDGTFISNGRLDQGEVGKTLRVTVTHDGSLNSCWGTIFVEDKNIPELICGMDTISCEDDFMDPNGTFWSFDSAEPRYRGFPIPASARAFPVSGLVNTYALINFDFCGSDTLRYSDNDDALSCSDGMSRRILRTWSITSRSGFTPIVCVDTIYIEKVVIDSIDFRDLIPHQSYRCDQKSSILDDDGYPDPDITGNLDDLRDDPCYQLNAGYTDTKAQLCGESMKFFRHWTVIDWCTTEDTTILQIISFEDKEDPAVSRPVVFDNVSDDHECTNTFSIRRPTFTDCSEIIEVRLELRIVGDADWTLWDTKTVTDEDFTNISFGTEGDEVEARYVLTDACGNVGESSASNEIDIQDNITPVAVCDEEVVITLNDQGVAYATYRTFDDGSTDNCGIVSYEIRRLDTPCDDNQSLLWGPIVGFCCFDLGQDDIRVELRVTDAAGNSNTCEALVSVQELATKIQAENVPPDVTVSCGTDLTDLEALYGIPVFLASVCGQKIDPTEVVIRNIDECGKGTVTRTWTATTNLGEDLPIELEPGTEVLSIQQVITVGSDDEVLQESDIVWPADIDTVGCISSLDPMEHPYIGFPVFENAPCSQPIATYEDQIFKNTEGFCAKVIRTWKVIDWCTVDSLDRNNPNALFFEHVQFIKLQDNVDPEITSGDTDVELDANTADCRGFYTFSATGTDDCETDLLKWVYELDIDDDGSIDATGKTNAFDITLPAGTHRIDWILSDGCDNLDEASQLVTIDASGCDVNTGNVLTISGKLFTENNHTVDNVNVKLTNAFGTTIMSQMTPINGEYSFEEVAANGTYNVEPVKNDNYGNGVSTADMVLIQNHILGLRTFDSPYKVIAADVNGSNSVSASDVILLQRLVLGLIDELPIQRSWSFVDATLQFDNILSPFPYVDIISMNDLSYSPSGMDFIAVKMGDVNGNVQLASATQPRSRNATVLTIDNEEIGSSKMFSIPVKATEGIDLSGIQMGMSFDKDQVEFLGVYGNGFEVTSQNINETLLKEGELLLSWSSHETISFEEGDAIFELRFAAKSEVNTKDVIEINDAYLQSELYGFSDDQLIITSFTIESEEGNEVSDELTLFQNTPNPFQTSTDIKFSIPKESYVQLDIYDLSGKSVFHHEQQYDAGINKVRISSDILTEGGLYIYQIADGNQIVQKKMIYIK